MSRYIGLQYYCSDFFYRTKEKLKSGAITVCGDQWPTMLYSGVYNSSDPWNGLLRNYILVRVSKHSYCMGCWGSHSLLKAYKHIFTSPSSVDAEPKATRSGNARIHGMLCTTRGSIAYIATQVFATQSVNLSSTEISNLRFALHYLHHRSSLAQTRPVTLSVFTTAS